MTKIEKLMAELLEETTKDLLKKIKSGDATPADIKNIRELLKDNNITSDILEESEPLAILGEELPFAPPIALVRK